MEMPQNKQFENLTGQIFGRYLVIEYAGCKYPNKSCKGHQWLCRCQCGNEKIILGNGLKTGNTQSCGCLHKEIINKRTIDLTGNKFGKLTVIKIIGKKNKQPVWLCKCDCGKTSNVCGNSLKAGLTKSCGCRQGNFTHGLSGKPGYKKHLLADPVRRLRHYVGSFVAGTLKNRHSSKGRKSVWQFLPYSPNDLKIHLESLFEPWMTWQNYGSKWHIDHIIAQMKFSFLSLDDPEFLKCWALSNLRPLEKIENLKKGVK